MAKNIFYRGFIDFCNYSCSYCPFAKKKIDKQKLKKEELELEKLYNFIKNSDESYNLMINPYGEAFILNIYQVYIARISLLKNVEKIGIQTNLSLDVDRFLENFSKENGYLSKLMIWATYHDEFADIEEFSRKVNRLNEIISISAGIVANLKNYDIIRNLRKCLDKDVYLWINAMDKLRISFDEEYIGKLSAIDPMFYYEFYRYRKDFSYNRNDSFDTCKSYDKLYIESGIYSNNCFFTKKKNIDKDCNNHKICDCYLGYCNFYDTSLSRFFGDNIIFRIPEKRKFSAVFIDIDGTMTDSKGRLYNNIEIVLKKISQKTDLYLATSRSFKSAKKLLGEYISYFKGGVFSDGAYVKIFKKNYESIIDIGEDTSKNILNDLKRYYIKNNYIYFDSIDKVVKNKFNTIEDFMKIDDIELNERLVNIPEKILRISMPYNIAEQIKYENIKKNRYENKCYIQNENASKYNGIVDIIEQNSIDSDDILVISDNIQDIEMFEKIKYTASPLKEKKLSKLSYYSINFEHLMFIL